MCGWRGFGKMDGRREVRIYSWKGFGGERGNVSPLMHEKEEEGEAFRG